MLLRTIGEWSSKRKESRAVRQFAKTFRRNDALVERYGRQEAAVMREEILEEFRRLAPDVPDIGGWRNPFSGFMKGGPRALAIYRVVLRHGGTVEDAGELLHRRNRDRAERIPRVIRHRMQKPLLAWQIKRSVRWSQARRYPDDMLFEMVEGDGSSFDFGYDVIECAAVKYFRAQGAEELCPYMCDLDYVLFESLGAGMKRTKTLAWGCDRCDFRISMNGDTTAPWPPRFAERTCGQPERTSSQDAGDKTRPTPAAL
jgi:hypothetical protein